MSNDLLRSNHHWVSQFLLRRFQIPERPGQVYAYVRSVEYPTMRNPRPRSIDEVAQRPGYNTLTSDDGTYRTATIEEEFGKLESAVAPIIEKIIGLEELTLSEEEQKALALYIAFLTCANPAFRKVQSRIFYEKRDEFLEYCRRKQTEDPNAAKILADPDGFFQRFEQNTKSRFALGGIRIAQELSQRLIDRKWFLIEAVGQPHFIIGDNPVISIPPEATPHDWSEGFLSRPVVLPISPTRAICLHGGNGFAPTLRIQDEVNTINYYSMYFAEDEVYSNLSSDSIKDMFSNTKEGESVRIFLDLNSR